MALHEAQGNGEQEAQAILFDFSQMVAGKLQTERDPMTALAYVDALDGVRTYLDREADDDMDSLARLHIGALEEMLTHRVLGRDLTEEELPELQARGRRIARAYLGIEEEED